MLDFFNSQKVSQKTIDKVTKTFPGLKVRSPRTDTSENLFELLVDKGYNEKYGARRMENAVRDYCLNPISAYITKNTTISDRASSLGLDEW